ncbi:MAG: polysaccharide deacetylase, partial [Verrucomicrobiaceae bacterium]|nr:polysaccharide deacetylase [Verrucomicrobiaceae bacterium]
VLLAAEALGYLPIYWTLDCLDSVGAKKSPDFIAQRVTRKLPREQMCGSIVLMHVDSMATADAVPEILSRFEEMGLSVVTVSRVLNEEGVTVQQTGLSSR